MMSVPKLSLFFALVVTGCVANLGLFQNGLAALRFKGSYFEAGFTIQLIVMGILGLCLTLSQWAQRLLWVSVYLILGSIFIMAFGTTGEHRTFDWVAAWPCTVRVLGYALGVLILAWSLFRENVFSYSGHFLLFSITIGLLIREPFCDSDRLNHYLFGHFLIPFLVLGWSLAYCRALKSMFDWRNETK